MKTNLLMRSKPLKTATFLLAATALWTAPARADSEEKQQQIAEAEEKAPGIIALLKKPGFAESTSAQETLEVDYSVFAGGFFLFLFEADRENEGGLRRNLGVSTAGADIWIPFDVHRVTCAGDGRKRSHEEC